MDEELLDITTEENVVVDDIDTVTANVIVGDEEYDVSIEQTEDDVQVESVEEIVINMEESVGWAGGDSTRHYSLSGRDEYDQHPITAITGLRDELDDIKALNVVYSNERNKANYYLWEDENASQENRVGYFVSICSDINKIKVCNSDNDIFGVTVDTAGFVGGQSDIARDIRYGLVVTDGLVHVRCESSVDIGDYVISNNYGYAQKNQSGYRVVGRHQINGVECAEIALVTPIGTICKLSNDVESLNVKVEDVETDIVVAINAAHDAYNKAGEAASVSEEVLKNALEALKKSEDTEAEVDKFLEETATSITEACNQAQERAESAALSALSAKDEAIAKANDAWAKADDVATETHSLVAKIDQYSVGEYSQAYGLTLEQARSILKVGMIYIPINHLDKDTHSETYLYIDDEGNQQETTYYFTPGNYYEWDGNVWQEYGNTVAFSIKEPNHSDALQYWYIDSSEAPDGYDAHSLYIWEDERWAKANILEGNINNRLTSMIRQTADSVRLEVTSVRGGIATLGARIDNVESVVDSTAMWLKGKQEDGEELYNIATIKQESDSGGSSLSLVVADVEGNKVLKGADIVLGQNGEDSYIRLNADGIELSGYVTIESLKGDGTTEINGSNIKTGCIQSENYVVNASGMSINLTDGTLDSANFKIDKNGKITATGGEIGGCKINNGLLEITNDNISGTIKADKIEAVTVVLKDLSIDGKLYFGYKTEYYINANYLEDDYYLKLPGLSISEQEAIFNGRIEAGKGYIGGWQIDFMGLIYEDSYDGSSSRVTPDFISMYQNGQLAAMKPGLIQFNQNTTLYDEGVSTYYRYGYVSADWLDIIDAAESNLTSDERIKNNIESLDDRYECFFDLLSSKRYKYNFGTSNRYHTGFIAQEVVDALEKSGLNTLDFAAVMLDNPGTEEECWKLRRDEFVSLNTWQIQKAKVRIAELEDRIATLEELINKK